MTAMSTTGTTNELPENFSGKCRGRPRSPRLDSLARLFPDYRSRRSIHNAGKWCRALNVLREKAAPEVFSFFEQGGTVKKTALVAMAAFNDESILLIAKEAMDNDMSSKHIVDTCHILRAAA